jgi:hypothetical protein
MRSTQITTLLWLLACSGDDTGIDPPVDLDGDGYADDDDCNDSDDAINPGATEVCDGVDNDCSGGVDDGLYATTIVEWDTDGDGEIDGMSWRVSDPDGNMLTEEFDSDMDGVPDSRHTYTYDAVGQQLTGLTEVAAPDGTWSYFQSWWATYDDNDCDSSDYTAVAYELDGDGIDDQYWILNHDEDCKLIESEEYTNGLAEGYEDYLYRTWALYDEDGEVTAYEYEYTYGTDSEIETYTTFYDADGHPVSAEFYELYADDWGSEEILDTVWYTTDDAGWITMEDYDFDTDGDTDALIGNDHDEHGNIVAVDQQDYSDDLRWGCLMYTATYEAPDLILDATSHYDLDCDGTSDGQISELYTYDGDGNLLSETYSRDDDADGSWDSAYTYAYTYDAEGRVLTENLDINGDGLDDHFEIYTYDDEGRLIEYVYRNDVYNDESEVNQTTITYGHDTWGNWVSSTYTYAFYEDGVVTETWGSGWWSVYDEDGHMLSYERDDDMDGTLERWDQLTYDDGGHLESWVADRDGDGVVDLRVTGTSECMDG